jgi:CRISPR/Cas system Type II protein with McrA/HNH and RuvC-like nuclease domain
LKKYDNSTLRNKLKKKYVQLCARQRREGKLFNVTFEQFAALWDSQRGKCFYTDTDLSIVVGNGKKANSLSVDRVRPDDGYEFENVVLAANRINGMKGDASLTEMRRWMPEWHERIITRHYWDANPEGKSADLRTAK